MSATYLHTEQIHNSRSASIVLPYLFSLYKPASILDVGCGLGNWLEVAKQLGIQDVMGVDGAYVNRDLLKLSSKEFTESDLTKPFDMLRKYDLVICLEVAEHLPETSASIFVESLVHHADILLFSAAIPGQKGQYHVNEQWPAYWQALFAKQDYVFLDVVRSHFWNDDCVDYWYRQNLFLVVKKGHPLSASFNGTILPLVHPELLRLTIEQYESRLQKLGAAIEKLSNRDVLTKLKKLLRP